MLLKNATLGDGSTVDVLIVGSKIERVTPATETETSPPSEPIIDLVGHLLVPAFAEPHAHLDKALTVDRVANPDGDLSGAIQAWLRYRTTITKADYVERATAAAMMSVANGCTAIRTHIDIAADIGTTGVEALLEVKAALADVVDLQLVGLATGLTDPVSGTENLAVLRHGLDMGLDLVGGVPHIEADPTRCIETVLTVAAQYGRGIDLHIDENLDPESNDLETLAARVSANGFTAPVAASHCVALSVKPEADQHRIAELVANAGISVVTLPQTNLYLQARNQTVAPPRGLTSLPALAAAGVTVAGGGDNLRDPFCVVGRADPLETAALLVMAGHLRTDTAMEFVSSRSRTVLGLADASVRPGNQADLVAIPATGIGEAVAAGPPGRVVIRRGVVVHDGR